MVQPPRLNTFSLAQTLGAVEGIRGARTRNALGGMALEQQRKAAKMQAEIDRIRERSENLPEFIKSLKSAGQFEEANRIAQEELGMMGKTATVIGKLGTLVRDQDTYDIIRAEILQSGVIRPEMMPVEYDKSFFKKAEKQIRGKMSTFERVVGLKGGVRQVQQVTQTPQGDVVAESPVFSSLEDVRERRLSREGRQRESRLREEKPAKKLTLPPAVSGEIRRQVADALNTIYDPRTGAINFKDNETRVLAKQVIEDAEQLIDSGAHQTIGAAVADALRRVNVPIQSTQNPDATNPLGLTR